MRRYRRHPLEISKEELIELYVNQEKTQAQIGKMYDVPDATISYWMKKYDIPARGNHLAEKKISIDVLKHMYYDEKLSIERCANNFGIGPSTLCKYMTRHGLKKRDRQEAYAVAKKQKQTETRETNKKKSVKKPSREPRVDDRLRWRNGTLCITDISEGVITARKVSYKMLSMNTFRTNILGRKIKIDLDDFMEGKTAYTLMDLPPVRRGKLQADGTIAWE